MTGKGYGNCRLSRMSEFISLLEFVRHILDTGSAV